MEPDPRSSSGWPAAGMLQREFVLPSVLGDWTLTPFVLRTNGSVLHGAEAPMHVRP